MGLPTPRWLCFHSYFVGWWEGLCKKYSMGETWLILVRTFQSCEMSVKVLYYSTSNLRVTVRNILYTLRVILQFTHVQCSITFRLLKVLLQAICLCFFGHTKSKQREHSHLLKFEKATRWTDKLLHYLHTIAMSVSLTQFKYFNIKQHVFGCFVFLLDTICLKHHPESILNIKFFGWGGNSIPLMALYVTSGNHTDISK